MRDLATMTWSRATAARHRSPARVRSRATRNAPSRAQLGPGQASRVPLVSTGRDRPGPMHARWRQMRPTPRQPPRAPPPPARAGRGRRACATGAMAAALVAKACALAGGLVDAERARKGSRRRVARDGRARRRRLPRRAGGAAQRRRRARGMGRRGARPARRRRCSRRRDSPTTWPPAAARAARRAARPCWRPAGAEPRTGRDRRPSSSSRGVRRVVRSAVVFRRRARAASRCCERSGGRCAQERPTSTGSNCVPASFELSARSRTVIELR
jgi:hypothetical protein